METLQQIHILRLQDLLEEMTGYPLRLALGRTVEDEPLIMSNNIKEHTGILKPVYKYVTIASREVKQRGARIHVPLYFTFTSDRETRSVFMCDAFLSLDTGRWTIATQG